MTRPAPTEDGGVEDLLRRHAPQVLGALVRRYGHFEASEDAVQEALLAAARQWPAEGVPDRPRAWLVTAASRRLVDELRRSSARARREERAGALDAATPTGPPPPGEDRLPDRDDTLDLLFLCCHPALTAPSQVALTLRAVGGLGTAEIARAFLVPEATMAQRISRAKARIREAGARSGPPGQVLRHGVVDGQRSVPQNGFGPLGADEQRARLPVVLHVLYLVFTEGHTASTGSDLQRTDLSAEAVRLTRAVHRARPDDPEVAGLLALMLLTDSRRGARTTADGALVPLAEQDRGLWDRGLVAEGVALVTSALPHGPVGPYQLQAAIAAVHAEAPSTEETDWAQVVALYDVLLAVAPNPVAALNRAVAVAEVEGPEAGLALVDALAADDRLAGHHRLLATRAHLLERTGDRGGAATAFREAARRTASLPEQRHLRARAARLDGDDDPAGA